MKSWLQENHIEMYSTYKEERLLKEKKKNRIHKYMTSVLKMSILIN